MKPHLQAIGAGIENAREHEKRIVAGNFAHSMPHRITLAIVCLHISAAIYALIGGLLFFDELDDLPWLATLMLVGCLLLAAGIEVVVWGLKRRKFWAWIAGICLFGLYVPSLFLPLGALGLWGLLDAGSRAEFGIGVAKLRGFEPTMPE